MRSASVSSVSTISTSRSRSPSPYPDRRGPPSTSRGRDNISRSFSRSPPPKLDSRARSITPPRLGRQAQPESEKKRRRKSVSSVESDSVDEKRESRERTSSRNTRRRYGQQSPVGRGRTTESRSPYRPDQSSNGRNSGRNSHEQEIDRPATQDRNRPRARTPPRQRSLSPFSKRLALTQAMNG